MPSYEKWKDGTIIFCLYIDDTLCVGDKEAIDAFKKEIMKYFVMKGEGKVEDYVGCIIKKINSGILLHQSDVLRKSNFNSSKKIRK